MPDFGFGRCPDFKAGSAGAEAIIGLFPEEEVLGFQKTDRFRD